MSAAGEHVASRLARPMVEVLVPTVHHWNIRAPLLESAQASGNLVTDAHLAALAVEHGVTLCSTDRDFARFPGLSWQNPLEA